MQIAKRQTSKLISYVLALAMVLSLLTGVQTKEIVFALGEEALNRSETVLFVGDDVYSADKTYLSLQSGNDVRLWASSNESVATVSPTGTVTAVGVGEAAITAYTADSYAVCDITVAAMPDDLAVPEDGNDNYSRANVHDPEILWVEKDGLYYMLCTHQTTIRYSEDLLSWTSGIDISGATRNSEATRFYQTAYGTSGTAFWAPDIFYNEVTGKYHVYYSVSSTLDDGGRGFGNRASAIGMATLEPVEGQEYSLKTLDNWVDGGMVVGSYDAWRPGGSIVKNPGNDYMLGDNNTAASAFGPNAIDPMIIWDKDHEHLYMVYGSFFAGIFLLEL